MGRVVQTRFLWRIITAKGYHAATGEPAPADVLANIARCDALQEEN